MPASRPRPRPAILTVIGGLSLAWSIASPLGVGMAFLIFAIVMTGTPSGINPLVQGIVLGWFVASPAVSTALFVAGWTMLNDDPRNLKWHRRWARISLVVDALILGALAMAMVPFPLVLPYGIAFIDLIYALKVLNAVGLPEVRAYFGEVPHDEADLGKRQTRDDDLA